MADSPNYAQDAAYILGELKGLKESIRDLTTTLKENTMEVKRQNDGLDARIRTLEIEGATLKGKFAVWVTIGILVGTPLAKYVMDSLFTPR